LTVRNALTVFDGLIIDKLKSSLPGTVLSESEVTHC
jgi:hypothetical protein